MKTKLEIELLDRWPLTPSEARALCQWLTGEPAKVAADRLSLSTRSMEIYIANIKEKLETRNRLVAFKKAEDSGMIKSRLVKLGCILIYGVCLGRLWALPVGLALEPVPATQVQIERSAAV